MATYVIEGTLSELKKEVSTKKTSTKKASIEKVCNIKIKVSGSEGYSVKRDKEIYNIFCPKDMPKEDEMKPCCIADSKFELSIAVDVEYENILAQALVSGKRVRLTLEVDGTKTLEEYVKNGLSLTVKSVTLLQN